MAGRANAGAEELSKPFCCMRNRAIAREMVEGPSTAVVAARAGECGGVDAMGKGTAAEQRSGASASSSLRNRAQLSTACGAAIAVFSSTSSQILFYLVNE